MKCPLCSVLLETFDAFASHMRGHGWDDWQIKQRWAERKLYQVAPRCRPESCTHAFYKVGLECELRLPVSLS